MALEPGDRLGPYEIQSPLGAGGMGQVYRARDTKLTREVAIKVLLASVANDPERLARFSREAQLLASLNHPNIAHIYGLEDTGPSTGPGRAAFALVMELVEGPTLADLIAHGVIPLTQALPIARQTAEALEAAHEQGIVHRDFKPSNIKVRPDGTVKVLDFGLAKACDPVAPSSVNATMSPTLSVHATQFGIILGTAAYMSPEQAAGKAVDKRSDLWAFGLVLFEMVTGRPVFSGETVSHVIADVLKTEPDWTALPAETPAAIRRLLRRCLEKDPKRRLDSAAVARLEIEDAIAGRQAESPAPFDSAQGGPLRRAAPAMIALAVACGAMIAALATFAVVRRAPQTIVQPARFTITPPPAQPLRIDHFDRSLAVSRDGRHVAYTATATSTGGPLFVRPIDQLEPRRVGDVTNARSPFFSPDGRWIGFFTDTELRKISIAGGPAITICAVKGGPRGASWDDDNTIVFATSDRATGLWRVAAGGGEPIALTTPGVTHPQAAIGAAVGDHVFPSVLPGRRGVLFTIAAPDRPDENAVAALDAKSHEIKTLIRGGSQAEYVDSGHLVYASAGTLRAARFDLAALAVSSDPEPVIEHVTSAETGAANYAVSRSGTLVYVPGEAAVQAVRSLVWVDRGGREEPIKAPPRAYAIPRISPDGTRIALDVRDQENDIWIWDLSRESLRRLTYGPASDAFPVWSPDGTFVIFSSNRDGASNLYKQAADGTGPVERLTTSGNGQVPTSTTPDGSAIVGQEGTALGFDIMLFRPGSPSKPLVQTPFIEHNSAISPDGRYLAYASNEAGQFQIYVRPFPDVETGKWQVSTDGGLRPAWSRNGRELFYTKGSTLIAVPLQTAGSTFAWGNSVKLFDRPYAAPALERYYDVSPDGKRFLMIKESSPGDTITTTANMVVVLNWIEELKNRMSAK